MNILMALATGILLGWGTSVKSGTDGREELIINIVVGSVGAFLGGRTLIAIYGAGDSGSLSFGAIAATVFGAATALVIVNRIRKA